MTDRMPIKHPIGVSGWFYLDGRTLRTEFPDMPKLNEEFELGGDVDLVRLAGMLLDQQDAERKLRR